MMIGEPENTENSVEKVTVGEAVGPADSNIEEDGQGSGNPDRSTDPGTATNASLEDETAPDPNREPSSEGPPSHPFAGLFDVAIDGVANLVAHFVRQGLGRILVMATTSTASKRPPTASKESSSPATAERKDGLLIAVAAAAIATVVLWSIFAPKKNSKS